MRTLLLLVIVFAGAGFAALFAIAGALAEPRLQDVKGPPDDLPFMALRIPRADGGSIAAWFAAGNAHRGGVLLVHGIRSDRRQLHGAGRARGSYVLKFHSREGDRWHIYAPCSGSHYPW